MKTKTILVVDDTGTVRTLTRFALSKAGYRVLEASNGEDALKILSEEKVDLLISDFNMPDMDGLILAQKVRKDYAEAKLPLLLLTTEVPQEVAARALELGITATLLKPFSPSHLVKAVDTTLGR